LFFGHAARLSKVALAILRYYKQTQVQAECVLINLQTYNDTESAMMNLDQYVVEHQLRLAQETLQRRGDKTDELMHLTRTLEMMTSLNRKLRAQLDSVQKDCDDWREQAQMAQSLLAEQRTAAFDAAAGSKH
jgi:hypothetical protein